MSFLAHTYLKRLANAIFELHPTDVGIDHVNNEIQPVVQVQPYINVVRNVSDSGTIYTTPADRDFYLTNIFISSAVDTSATTQNTDSVNFTLIDNTTGAFDLTYASGISALAVENVNSNANINYPNRGILLKRNSTITFTRRGSLGSATISGYTASDRSGE